MLFITEIGTGHVYKGKRLLPKYIFITKRFVSYYCHRRPKVGALEKDVRKGNLARLCNPPPDAAPARLFYCSTPVIPLFCCYCSTTVLLLYCCYTVVLLLPSSTPVTSPSERALDLVHYAPADAHAI